MSISRAGFSPPPRSESNSNTVHLSVAQAVKPAEPRFISAFFSFPRDSSPSATTNESWINGGVAFPTYGRKARACLSRGISTGACHTRSIRRQTNRMRDKPLSGWTDISTPPWWTALLETTAHRATGSGFHPLRRAASAILRTRSIRRHGEPCAPAGAAARKPQPILTNPKGLHRTRGESVARTHGPAILTGGILRPRGARRSGIGPHQRVH